MESLKQFCYFGIIISEIDEDQDNFLNSIFLATTEASRVPSFHQDWLSFNNNNNNNDNNNNDYDYNIFINSPETNASISGTDETESKYLKK